MASTRPTSIVAVGLGVALLASPAAEATPTTFGSNAYEFVDGGISWPDAKLAAEVRVFDGVSGHLVTIGSAGENAFVLSLLAGLTGDWLGVWIGATDRDTEGDWRWVTGEALSFSNWAAGQPDDYELMQDYAVMLAKPVFAGQSAGEWDDIPEFFAVGYVVEFDDVAAVPEPSTLMLVGLGVVALDRRRRRRTA
jgi:hypothetical protein